MKRAISAILALMLLCSAALPASAENFLAGLNGLMGLFTDAEEESELPDLNREFTGETVKVQVGGTTVRVHAEFKDAMDKYEEFFAEYVELMSDDDPDMLAFSAFMMKSVTAMASLEALNDAELSNDDMVYYLDVMTRIYALLANTEAETDE